MIVLVRVHVVVLCALDEQYYGLVVRVRGASFFKEQIVFGVAPYD
jgi:hypothetical protein